ncbi:hypothetical protein BC833DRAFT_78085 [Globomyces pollinis-pini]|nr:hypothetical protein BC833DRAFT_78085 [Globomyces pollinis-pini]
MTSILNQNSRKKKLAELVNSVHKSWVNLMLNLNLVIQQEQKSNQANTSDNLTKLAVATGLTDWLDLNVNDAKAVYMQGEKYLLGYGVPQSFETAYKRYESAAKSNLPEALNMMGVMCEFGLGRQTDIALGHKYYTMAAKLDCPEALNHLGRLNESGKGCEVSYKNAVASYKRASQLGFDDATTNYGYMVEHGLGCPEDKRLAFELYKSAADKGFARAQNALGNCFYKGIGVSKDYFQASILYRKASEQGYTPAHNNLGICYEEGQGVPKDLGQAKVCYKQAAEKHHPNATNNLGYMLLLEKNYIEAIQQFYLAKTLGNVDATFQLGYLYELGCSDNSGVILGPDLHMALRFYQECAVKGHIKAILRMASLLICGPESIMDIPTAVSILNIAANPPNSRKPSTKDDPENRVIQASLHGDPDAQNLLGIVYY